MKDRSVGTAVWQEQRYQLLEGSEWWSRNPAVVDLDLDGRLELWYGASQVLLFDVGVQRNIARAEIWGSVSNDICMVTHLPDYCGKTSWQCLSGTRMVKSTELGVSFCSPKTRIVLIGVDDINMAGGKLNVTPMWKKLMKLVDLGQPTSFLGHMYLGCTQRECKPNATIIAQIFVCVVTRSTTAEVQHNDMMMWTNVQNDLRHEMALEMWIVSVHEKSEQR